MAKTGSRFHGEDGKEPFPPLYETSHPISR